MYTITIVEDDPTIRTELTKALRVSGYEVRALDTFGEATVGAIQATEPDLILLDLGLPGTDGQFVCRELRRPESSTALTPLIVVTSRDNDMDELLAMNSGADDYVTKPYNIHVVLARISRVLERTRGSATAGVSHHARCGLVLNPDRAEVSYHGATARLTRNELGILSMLLKNEGTVVSRHRLQVELWQSDEFVGDNTLTVNVSHLRATLESIGAHDIIHTQRGVGYRIG